MKIFKISELQPSLDLSGDVFIHPTNSCYGIWTSINNKKWYNRIYEIKSRDISKPFFVTVLNLEKASKIAVIDDRIESLIQKFPEKIFTFILKRSPGLPEFINPGIETVWIQIASWPLIEICHLSWWMMLWTSANISGKKSIYNFSEIQNIFSKFPDIFFIDGWNLEKKSTSTIVDLSWHELKILRGELV